MKNIIIDKFRKKTLVQIFVDDDSVKLKKITNGIVNVDVSYSNDNISNLYYYINSIRNAEIQIIYLSDITFRYINSVKINNTGIKELLTQNISNSSGLINTSFFTKKHVDNENIVIDICDVLFSDFSSTVINKLMSNNIKTITPWPIWIVDNYFRIFKYDSGKFGASILIVKDNNLTEIIAVSSDNKINCYRKFLSDDISEKEEILNTMFYISNQMRISIDDIAIYYINDKILQSFTKPSNHEVLFVSTVIKENSFVFAEYNESIKIALRGLFLLFSSILAFRVYDTYNLKNMVSEAHTIISSVPKHVVSERTFWSAIPNNISTEINYKSITTDILRTTKNLQILTLKINKNNDGINIKMKTLNADTEENKHYKNIISNMYRFNIDVIDGEIICNGTHC